MEKNTVFEKRLIYLATKDINEATEENILAAYNKEYGTRVKVLTEAEYSALCSRLGILISKMTSGKRDAISEFAMKNQFQHITRMIIGTRGFYFMLFVYLMSKLRKI
jgi:hypothetical protein